MCGVRNRAGVLCRGAPGRGTRPVGTDSGMRRADRRAMRKTYVRPRSHAETPRLTPVEHVASPPKQGRRRRWPMWPPRPDGLHRAIRRMAEDPPPEEATAPLTRTGALGAAEVGASRMAESARVTRTGHWAVGGTAGPQVRDVRSAVRGRSTPPRGPHAQAPLRSSTPALKHARAQAPLVKTRPVSAVLSASGSRGSRVRSFMALLSARTTFQFPLHTDPAAHTVAAAWAARAPPRPRGLGRGGAESRSPRALVDEHGQAVQDAPQAELPGLVLSAGLGG